ncbi:pantoate--beta-alanine ligase [Corynebacterium fournieri]|uniref:pantoate--beta-alanine ligase n=1 Tax=Corynebacterium fournieri TaxID=1852390 RepID=UPI000A2F7CC0|nr:pantoate--beta-alanine ligase [Corynebacterium fournieri]WJY98366.1 Pantothenate synthetase [Corynebacterium fournieri]
MTQLVHTPEELASTLPAGDVSLVPTMGALHDGHLALVRAAKALGNPVVVSIFVNPLQFAPGEDLDAYPRTLPEDVAKLEAEGVDAVFAPTAETMYPRGPRTTIHPGPLGSVLEGATRPTHFAGVLTVVAKLFALTRATDAFFGEKDYQQLALIRQMVDDLHLPVRIHGCPIVRDTDGLALSSRNRYLSAEERATALALPRALATGSLAEAGSLLRGTDGLELDYLVATAEDLTELPDGHSGPARLLVAAKVGTTRLLDNAAIEL